jgi:hypothetical protein
LNYYFDWNVKKSQTNLKKHKITFEKATEIFYDPLALSLYDDLHSEDEDRWITLGVTKSGTVIVVIHTYSELNSNNVKIRIISARKATKNEIKQYQGE